MSGYVTSKENVIVATHIEPPLIYKVGDEYIGSNADIIRLIAKKLKKSVSFVECPFARCLVMTRNGQADMMIAINKTPERMEFLRYLDKPFKTSSAQLKFYLARSSGIEISKFEDLKRLKVGVLRGAAFYPEFDSDHSIEKVKVSRHSQLVQLLLRGRIDTFLGREEAFKRRIPEEVYTQKLMVADYFYNKTMNSYIVISKNSVLEGEHKIFSKAQAELLKNGKIEQILSK